MEVDQSLFAPSTQQIDYSTLLSIIREELKKLSHSSQTFSYQTACRYGPKDHDILAFEVRVLHKILDNIPHDNVGERALAELQVKNATLEDNIQILKSQLFTLAAKNSKLVEQQKEIREMLTDKERKLMVLMKKSEQFDRMGGRLKFEKLEQEVRELNGKLASALASEKKATERSAELQRQTKLQKELNSQQESALVDMQIENDGLRQRINQLESKQTSEPKQKENQSRVANTTKADLETLALKQKLKEQSSLLESLRTEFETAKAHWLKKEQHYSKFVEKCFMKDQPL